MSALAICLKQLNEMVIGSDSENEYFTEKKLNENKIPIFLFNKDNIEKYNNYTFIISYAYDEHNNEEVKQIIEKGYKYYYYSDFINEYFKNIKIGVSGTHGKTTTCTMLKNFFEKEEVAYIIGDGTGGGVNNYKYFIFEACEYKYHFINYDYDYLIINNIDYDHPDFYNNIDEVINAFKNVIKKAKCIIVNNDDKNLKKIKHRSKYTYGINNKSFVNGTILKEDSRGYKIKVTIKENEYIFDLPIFGLHMVYNFLASLTVYYLLKKDYKKINEVINDKMQIYKNPTRRNQEYKIGNNIIIDDYAHHPSEIDCLYKSVKQKYEDYEISIVFQPHTYSRTIYLNKEFKQVLSDKKVYIMDTFPSREKYDKLKEKIVKEVFENCEIYSLDKIKKTLMKNKQIIIFMGAGSINNEINLLLNEI